MDKLGEIGGLMKTIAAIHLLSCCLLSCGAFGQDKVAVFAAEAACGPRDVGFEVTADESRPPTPTPENSKAVIYVVQDGGTTRVGADGKWLGALKGRTYFSVRIDPGEHHFCAITRIGAWSHVSLHGLNAKEGESYYFYAHIVGAAVSDEFALLQVDPDEGKYLVAKAKFSSSHPK